MNWVLVIWLASSNNYTIYEKFSSQEECLSKQAIVTRALNGVESKMKTECRTRKPGDAFKKGEVTVTRYILR